MTTRARRQLPLLAAGGDDAIGHVDRLADDAEARRVLEADAPVRLVPSPVISACSGAVNSRRSWNVVDLAVGDHDRAGEARGRYVAERTVQRAEQPGLRAVVRRAGLSSLDHAHLKLLEACEPLLHAADRLIGLAGARADILALAAVDDQGDDAFHRLALFVEEDRIDESARQRQQRREAKESATLP